MLSNYKNWRKKGAGPSNNQSNVCLDNLRQNSWNKLE